MSGPIAGRDWPKLGMGCARVGSFSNPATLAQSRALLEEAARAGFDLFDTADIYGQGDSERAVGAAAARLARRPVIVTKGGQRFSAKASLLRPFKPLLRPLLAGRGTANAVTSRRGDNMHCDWSAAYLARTLPASLRRLRVPAVDAFLLHSPPAHVIDDPATVATLTAFAERGQAREVGISCEDLHCLDAALRVPIYTVVELDWPDIEAIRGSARAQAIMTRKITVIARGILSHAGEIDPLQAFARAIAEPLVTTTLIGTQTPERLRTLTARFGVATTREHP